MADVRRALTDARSDTEPGQTRWWASVAGADARLIGDGDLRRYDARILECERRLDAVRNGFAFKYFQYAALHVHVVFVEPHGLHHGGLSGNRDKIDAFLELRTLSRSQTFRSANVSLAGYMLTTTPPADIPGAERMDWGMLRRDYGIVLQSDPYIELLLHLE